MTADDIDPATLAAIRVGVENTSLLGGLVALLVAKGIIGDEELTAARNDVHGLLVAQTAAKYDLPANELEDLLR